MKIALIHYRLVQKGGLERRLINYINCFHKRGYEVKVFASKRASNLDLPDGVEFIQVRLGIMPKMFRQWYFAKRLKKIMRAYSFDFTLSLGRTFSQSMVLDGGNHMGYMECLGKKRKFPKDLLNIFLDQQAFAVSDTILACSGFIKDFNIQYYQTPKDKIKILYPPINTTQFNQSLRKNRAALRAQFEISPQSTAFLFVSTGHKMKNLSFLLQLFSQLENRPIELLIAGTPPKRRLPNNTRYLGYVKKPELIYTAVDYTIHPALYEPFGQVVVESIQCGTPVIISKNVGAKEVVSDKEAVVVSSFSIKDWIAEIDALDKKKFEIHPSFAEDRYLTLDQHIDKILSIAQSA
ncbi:MAG: glycosyltransferase family 4 protein [Bacteroidota bacterium]